MQFWKASVSADEDDIVRTYLIWTSDSELYYVRKNMANKSYYAEEH